MEPPTLKATTLGPYRLVERLGAGAMGAVYSAESSDGPVALKVIHPHLLERSGYFKRFQREAEAGRRVEHPNVVRTFDCDLLLAEGEPCFFLVMEYVRGRTLGALLEAKGALPEALVREIGRQVAAGLAAIHEAGIVHRDLKPENVMIADDHRVRIMDLGVARLEGATTHLTRSGQFAGSLWYAAPEQFRGETVGPSADLYALGVLLYELVAGVNPFRHDQAAAVMRAYRDEVPPRLDDRQPEVSLFLAELVHTLLQKHPDARFPSAESVRAVLGEGERSSWWAERRGAAKRRASRLPRIPVPRETSLHGREAELASLHRTWETARDGGGTVLWLVGEAGIGKSRLVDEFLRELDDTDVHVLYGAHLPTGRQNPVADALLRHFGESRLEEALGHYLVETPKLAAPIAAACRYELPPPDAPPHGDALHAAYAHVMRSLAEEKPLLWVVEDLHLADAVGVKRLLAMARAVEGHRVLLILTTRPDLQEKQRAAFERLGSLARCEIGPLGADAVTGLLRDALRNPALADKLGARIATKSDGIPFFVLEIIRSLKARRLVAELPDGVFEATRTIEGIDVPSAVKDLLRARLHGLSRDERGVLEIAAVEGFAFDLDLVARVREQPRIAVLEILAGVERRHGVVRVVGDGYRFDYHQTHDAILEDLSEALEREVHGLLADAFAVREGLVASAAEHAPGGACLFMASHGLDGPDPTGALPWLGPALRYVPAEQRSEQALALVQRALGVSGLVAGRERVDLLLTGGSRLDLLGRSQEAVPLAEEALSLARGIEDAGLCSTASRMLGWVLQHAGRLEDAERRLRESVELASASGTEKLQMEAAGLLGALLLVTERGTEAKPHLERQLHLARTRGDRRAEASARGNLGLVLFDEGCFDEARTHQLEALALFRANGDLLGESRAIGNLGLIAADVGQSEEALARYAEQLRIAREIGDRRGEANARVNLSAELLARGEYDTAGEHLQYQLALARDLGDPYLEWIARWNLGELAWAQGRTARARENFEVALEMSRVFGSREGEAELLVNLGRLAAGMGEAAGARRRLEAAFEISREIRDVRIESLALLGLSQAASLGASTPEAVSWAERAVRCVRERDDGKARIEPLLELGSLAAISGDAEQAQAVLAEVLDLAEACSTPGPRAVAEAYLAIVTGDATPAVEALADAGRCLSHGERLAIHAVLWKVTQEASHLEAAWHLLEDLRAHAPEEHRASLLRNVPLHREVVDAWAEHGERGEADGGVD